MLFLLLSEVLSVKFKIKIIFPRGAGRVFQRGHTSSDKSSRPGGPK